MSNNNAFLKHLAFGGDPADFEEDCSPESEWEREERLQHSLGRMLDNDLD